MGNPTEPWLPGTPSPAPASAVLIRVRPVRLLRSSAHVPDLAHLETNSLAAFPHRLLAELAEDEGEDAAVAHVLDVGQVVEAGLDSERHRVGHHSECLAWSQSGSKAAYGEGFPSGQTQRSGRLAGHELEG